MKKILTLNEISNSGLEPTLVKSSSGMMWGECISPVRHNGKIKKFAIENMHLNFALITQGQADLIINGTRVHAEKDQLIVLTQGSTVWETDVPPEFEAQFVDFTVEQLCQIVKYAGMWSTAVQTMPQSMDLGDMKGSSGLPSLLMFYGESFAIRLTGSEAEICSSILSMIGKTLKENYTNTTMILLASLYDLGKEAFLRSRPRFNQQELLSRSVLNRFLGLVNQHCNQYRTLDFYARELCLNKSYLGVLVRKASGSTATQWIEHITMLRIKSMLTNTNLTVNQIADKMHFQEPQNLSRYFKRLTGLSPTEYRQKVREAK